MTGMADSPEMALISESVESANARIRFFRIAYGSADRNQVIKSGELQAALKSSFQARNLLVDWTTGDMPRDRAKLAFLVLQCLESALPYGGRITVSVEEDGLNFDARADRVAADNQLWDRLTRLQPCNGLRPAQVQFGLLAELARTESWRLKVELGQNSIRVIAAPTGADPDAN